jgi:protein gp37
VSATSSIEWTDRTWNPVRGCSVISPGCVNCYAMKFAHRFSAEGKPYAGLTKLTKAGPQWTGIVRPIETALLEPARWRKPARVFVNSMSDLFHESLDPLFIGRVFNVMAAEPRHTFQVLTKRPARMLEVLTAYYRSSAYGPIPNVWLGVSVEDQKHADERIPLLLQTPAAVRFISAEPLLDALSIERYVRNSYTIHVSMSVEGAIANRSFDGLTDEGRPLSRAEAEAGLRALAAKGVKLISAAGGECVGFSDQTGCPRHPTPRLDWVIVGGESGPGARPFDLAWARRIVQQCQAASVPVFVKQVGTAPINDGRGPYRVPRVTTAAGAGVECEHGYDVCPKCDAGTMPLVDKKGGDPSEWPEDLRVRQFPEVPQAWDGRERRRWGR